MATEHKMLYLTEEDLRSSSKSKDIRELRYEDFHPDLLKSMHQYDHILYTHGPSMKTKILKDRFGDRGLGIIAMIVDDIKEAIKLKVELSDQYFTDMKKYF